jgi:hypothetical protein
MGFPNMPIDTLRASIMGDAMLRKCAAAMRRKIGTRRAIFMAMTVTMNSP